MPLTGNHRYQTCRDEHCERFPCRVHKEGYHDGFQTGWESGYEAGHDAGYDAGFAAGLASCPGPHTPA